LENGSYIPQFNFDFEDENTMQADYEAIDWRRLNYPTDKSGGYHAVVLLV
jgi:hypothetical protein